MTNPDGSPPLARDARHGRQPQLAYTYTKIFDPKSDLVVLTVRVAIPGPDGSARLIQSREVMPRLALSRGYAPDQYVKYTAEKVLRALEREVEKMHAPEGTQGRPGGPTGPPASAGAP